MGEQIGSGSFGKVFKGQWHGKFFNNLFDRFIHFEFYFYNSFFKIQEMLYYLR